MSFKVEHAMILILIAFSVVAYLNYNDIDITKLRLFVIGPGLECGDPPLAPCKGDPGDPVQTPTGTCSVDSDCMPSYCCATPTFGCTTTSTPPNCDGILCPQAIVTPLGVNVLLIPVHSPNFLLHVLQAKQLM
jgi:hypothetical protein